MPVSPFPRCDTEPASLAVILPEPAERGFHTVVYAITKEVFDNIEDFRKLHPAFGEMGRKGKTEGLSDLLCPGAQKYFKQIGFREQAGLRK